MSVKLHYTIDHSQPTTEVHEEFATVDDALACANRTIGPVNQDSRYLDDDLAWVYAWGPTQYGRTGTIRLVVTQDEPVTRALAIREFFQPAWGWPIGAEWSGPEYPAPITPESVAAEEARLDAEEDALVEDLALNSWL